MVNRATGYIFLVEDSPDDVDLTKRALLQNNITNEIIVAKDGEEALNFLFNHGELQGRVMKEYPVVTLLDIKMPKIDGMQVLKRIREDEYTKLLPVVILTSSTEEKDIVNGYELGANSYVSKPVDFKQFLTAVKQLGLYWLLLNEPVPISGK
jgi:two-component system, response regulator